MPSTPPLARALLPPLLLGLLALALTVGYYGAAYRAWVQADDRIRGLFAGFQSLEGADQPYRWSRGAGTVCLPAAGPARPPLSLDLRLLGSAVTAGIAERPIDRAELRVGALALPLAIAPESRAYRLLLPPGPEPGPICLTMLSETIDPGNNRPVGVGLRFAALERLAPSPPPPAQLATNLWLALGGYWLLRRLRLPAWPAAALVGLISLALGAALIGGQLRVAPDLPFWSGFSAVGLGLLLGALRAYQLAAPGLAQWRRELIGSALIAALLALGWYALARLEGYAWPFPLMARTGYAFGWGALPATALFAAYAWQSLRWAAGPQRAGGPPAALVIGAGWLAAAALPAALKAGLRGWESLFQHFGIQEGNYIRDVPLVGGDPLGFLTRYVAIMPELQLHNKTHPPGSTLFLWAVERLFGPGPEPATWATIALAATVVWPIYRLAEALSGPRAAALAVAVAALLPAHMIYAATSMDALFAVPMAWATWCLYAALVLHDAPIGGGPATLGPEPSPTAHRPPPSPQAQLLAALAAGLWIAAGLLFSFTTLMLAFVVLALVARRLALGPRRPADVLHWAALGAVIAGGALLPLALIWLATGYHSIAAFFSGVANNRADVGARISPLGLSSYLFFLWVNAVAYGCYLGPWALYRLGAAAAAAVGRSELRPHRVRRDPGPDAGRDPGPGPGVDAGPEGPRSPVPGPPAAALHPPPQGDALALGAAALLLGMLGAGLFFREVERIWLFSHILIAATLADGIMRHPKRRQRLALAALLLATLFAHSVIFRAVLRVSW